MRIRKTLQNARLTSSPTRGPLQHPLVRCISVQKQINDCPRKQAVQTLHNKKQFHETKCLIRDKKIFIFEATISMLSLMSQ